MSLNSGGASAGQVDEDVMHGHDYEYFMGHCALQYDHVGTVHESQWVEGINRLEWLNCVILCVQLLAGHCIGSSRRSMKL